MVIQLTERKNKLLLNLNILEKQPQSQAEKKGQITENLRISENEKVENEKLIQELDTQIDQLRIDLSNTKDSSIEIRERKASSSATIEGQTTAYYIQDSLKNTKVKITKLAQGLPVGGEIESLDDGTLFSAFKNRTNLKNNLN